MKKILYYLLIFSLYISLFSCTTPPETTPTSEETIEPEYTDELPFNFALIIIDKIMYKVYPEEGVIVPACVDPLCKHSNDSCPMTRIGDSFVKDGLYYYVRCFDDRMMYGTKICTYDLISGEYKVLYKTENYDDSITYLQEADNYLFFSLYNPRSKGENQNIRVMRYNIDSGEIVTLADNLPDKPTPLEYSNERMYWYDATGFFSTDINFTNKKEDELGCHFSLSTGGYGLEQKTTGKIINNGIAYPEREIFRVDLETREKSLLIKSTGTQPLAYKGKVIYARTDEAEYIGTRINSVDGKEQKVYGKYGSKLYICNIDGSEDRLLCDISGNNCAHPFGVGASAGCPGSGDYIIRRLEYYEPMKNNPEYIQRGQDKVLVVNIVTGEYKILSAE